MSRGPGHRPPLSPREGWLSDGRQVLHFQPVRWDRWNQPVEVTVGGQPCAVTAVTATAVTCTLAAESTGGPVVLRVRYGGEARGRAPLRVNRPRP